MWRDQAHTVMVINFVSEIIYIEFDFLDRAGLDAARSETLVAGLK